MNTPQAPLPARVIRAKIPRTVLVEAEIRVPEGVATTTDSYGTVWVLNHMGGMTLQHALHTGVVSFV